MNKEEILQKVNEGIEQLKASNEDKIVLESIIGSSFREDINFVIDTITEKDLFWGIRMNSDLSQSIIISKIQG